MPWVLNSLLGLQMLAPLAFPRLWQIGFVGYNYCYLVVISWQGRRDMDNSCVLWLLEVRVLSGFKVLIVGVASVTVGGCLAGTTDPLESLSFLPLGCSRWLLRD